MLTAGEIVTNVSRYYMNVSPAELAKDPSKRARILFALREVMTRVWTLAPLSQRHGSGTITIDGTTGIGPCPTDFGGLGTTAVLYDQGRKSELTYMPEQELKRRAVQYPDSGQPQFYTQIRDTTAGRAQIQVWPRDSITVQIESYNRRCYDPIDYPVGPTVTAISSGSLTGAYRWKAVYAWPDGTTEGGLETSLTLAAENARVRVPVPPARAVTGITVYRTLAGGEVFKLSGTADATTIVFVGNQPYYQYTDNISDTDLGVTCPRPGDTGVLTGVEQFPEDFIESVLFEGAVVKAMTSQGDMRDAGFWQEFQRQCRRMWADQKPGQASPRRLIQFGEQRGTTPLDPRYRYGG